MKILHANGANIPALGFGTWQLKGDLCAQMVQTALAAGYRHIDTAIMYDNERRVGAGLRASGVARGDVFLTTKVWPDQVRDGPFQRAVEGSLERLGVEYVDLLLIHWPPKPTDIQSWAALLNDVADRGLTRNIGVSNFTIDMINEMMRVSQRPLACNQVERHPYIDQSRLVQTCKAHGIALIGYCPIYRGGPLFNEPAVQAAAAAHGKTAAQVVLRWHMQGDNTGAIPKTATPARAGENLAIFDFALSSEEMASISALTARNHRLCNYDFSPVWDVA